MFLTNGSKSKVFLDMIYGGIIKLTTKNVKEFFILATTYLPML